MTIAGRSTVEELDQKVLEATSSLLKRWLVSSLLPAENRTEAILAIAALDAANARRSSRALIEPLKQYENQVAEELCITLGLDHTKSNDTFVGSHLSSVAGAMAMLATMPREREIDAAKGFRDFLIHWYEPVDPVISQGTRPIYSEYEVDDRAAIDPLIITREKVQAYLNFRFPDRQIQVLQVDALRGGYSKGTYVVEVREDGNTERIVLRQDKPGLPTGSSVTDEFLAIGDVYPKGVKAPPPLWVEGDCRHFATAVMAVGFKAGKPGRTFPAEPERRRKWTSSTAKFMASLHRIKPEEPGDVKRFMRRTLDGFHIRIERAEHTPHPGLAFGLAWLERNLDVLADRPVCRTHGDLAFHNILMHEDEISTVVDWEFTQFSDPCEDIAYIMPFLKELGFWSEFLEEYLRLTGYEYDAAVVHWFKVFNSVRIAICNLSILHLILTTGLNDVALLVAGGSLLQKFEIELLDTIIDGPSATI